jgi:hypothetical protein
LQVKQAEDKHGHAVFRLKTQNARRFQGGKAAANRVVEISLI